MSADPGAGLAPDWSAHVGLCSVTLRRLPPEDVIAVARSARLRCIEWGADVHAPPGDRGRLAALGDRSRESGVAVSSYGSYWRAGVSPSEDMTQIAAAAAALGAARVRVWAGDVGTDDADEAVWDRVVHDLRRACEVARDHGVDLALEFHPQTLTDSVETTLELLDRVGDDALRTYWQPRLDERHEPAVDGLRRLVPFLAGVHVFSWWPAATRIRLAGRSTLWASVIELLVAEVEPCDLLLEFVPDDDPGLVAPEAEALRGFLLAEGQRRA